MQSGWEKFSRCKCEIGQGKRLVGKCNEHEFDCIEKKFPLLQPCANRVCVWRFFFYEFYFHMNLYHVSKVVMKTSKLQQPMLHVKSSQKERGLLLQFSYTHRLVTNSCHVSTCSIKRFFSSPTSLWNRLLINSMQANYVLKLANT